MFRRLVATSVLGLLGGCTRASENLRFEPAPAALRVVSSEPQAGADLAPSASLALCWSAFLDPGALLDTDALLSSGGSITDGTLGLQLRPWTAADGSFDLQAAEPWCAHSVVSVTPKEPLQSGLRYRLRLDNRVRGWAGETADPTAPQWRPAADEDSVDLIYTLEFNVRSQTTPEPQPPQMMLSPSLVELFNAGNIFDPSRDTCSCHRDPQSSANALLDLRGPDAAYQALLQPQLRGTGYPMVSPRAPSQSYLLHKMLHDDNGLPLRGVRGDTMPLGDTLDQRDYVMIAAWIAAGAEYE